MTNVPGLRSIALIEGTEINEIEVSSFWGGQKIRLSKRSNINKYDKFDYSFYNKVQNGFLKLAKSNKYLIINSNINNVEENSQIIINKLNKLIY